MTAPDKDAAREPELHDLFSTLPMKQFLRKVADLFKVEEIMEGVPKCPNYMAHPQAVWFEEHWLPIIKDLKSRLADEEMKRVEVAVLLAKRIEEHDSLRAEVERLGKIITERHQKITELKQAKDAQEAHYVENLEGQYRLVRRLEERVTQLEEALKFYAEGWHYRVAEGSEAKDGCEATLETGEVARAALGLKY